MSAAAQPPTVLDHVAICVEDRRAASHELCDRFGWRELDAGGARLSLLGVAHDAGKLTLLESRGAATTRPGRVHLGSRVGAQGVHVVGVTLLGGDPESDARQLGELWNLPASRSAAGWQIRLGDTWIEFVADEAPAATGADVLEVLIDHIGLLVDRLEDVAAIAPVDIVDAENSRAAFFAGPAGYRYELVEHKASFISA